MTRWEEWLAAEAAAPRRGRAAALAAAPRPADGATVDLAGNDYLGLSRDPAVVEAAAAAAAARGAPAPAPPGW